MSYRIIEKVPHKKRLEVLFMSHDEPNHQQLAHTTGLSLETVEAILYYKNSIMLDWKRSRDPFYKVPPNMHTKIAFIEILMEWKRRTLLTCKTVNDRRLKSKAIALKNVFHIKERTSSHTWLQNFEDTYEKRQFSGLIRSSTKLTDILTDLLSGFPNQIQRTFSEFFEAIKEYDTESLRKVKKGKNTKNQSSEIAQKNVKINSTDTEKMSLQTNCNDINNDSDSDVEEIINPIDFVDITEDEDYNCDEITNDSLDVLDILCKEEITDSLESDIDDNSYKPKMYDKNEMQQPTESINFNVKKRKTDKQTDIVPDKESEIVSVAYENIQNKAISDNEFKELFLKVEENHEPDCSDSTINYNEINKNIIRVKKWNELCAGTIEEAGSVCDNTESDDDEMIELLMYVTDNDESDNEGEEQ